MFRPTTLLIGLCLVAACAHTPQISPAVRADLAPTGTLRVGINFGNVLLASRDPSSGAPRGIAVDLMRELGRRSGVPVELVAYESAGRMAEGARPGAWDAAFLAVGPDRSGEIDFTAPYLEIDTTHLVPAGSPLRDMEDVDRKGVRIAVSDKSAYDLFLTRSLKQATLMRAPNVDASVALFVSEKLEALAGLKPALLDVSKSVPGSRVLDGRFTTVQQAVGTPKGRRAGRDYLREFVEDIKTSGLVAETIQKNGVHGVLVASAAP